MGIVILKSTFPGNEMQIKINLLNSFTSYNYANFYCITGINYNYKWVPWYCHCYLVEISKPGIFYNEEPLISVRISWSQTCFSVLVVFTNLFNLKRSYDASTASRLHCVCRHTYKLVRACTCISKWVSAFSAHVPT